VTLGVSTVRVARGGSAPDLNSLIVPISAAAATMASSGKSVG